MSDKRRSLSLRIWHSVSEAENVTSPFRERSKTVKNNRLPHLTSPVSNYVDITNSRLFGVPIAAALERAPDVLYGTVPTPLRNAIDYINKFHLDEQGLYRVSGNKRVIEQYREEFDRGEFVDFIADATNKSRVHEPHDVTGLVRVFITTLPETIFTDRLCGAFQLKEFSPDPDNPDEINAKIERLRQLIDVLPIVNRDSLRLFIKHLFMITKHSQTNMMTAKNLVISLFGMGTHTRAYYLLITHCDKIFIDDEAAPRSTTTLSPAMAGDEITSPSSVHKAMAQEQIDLDGVRKMIEEQDKREAEGGVYTPAPVQPSVPLDPQQRKKLSALRRASVRINVAVTNLLFGKDRKKKEDENE
jgi:hypothetical protein